MIKNTAFLEFRLCAYPESGGGLSSRDEILQHYSGQLPDDVECHLICLDPLIPASDNTSILVRIVRV